MPPATPSTATRQSDWFAEVEGFQGTWATVGAPSFTGTATKVADGGGPMESLPDEGQWADMSFSRPYKRDRDRTTLQQMKARYGQAVTVTIFCKSPDGVVADTFTVLGRIGGFTGAAGDRQSSSPASLDFTLNVDDVVF